MTLYEALPLLILHQSGLLLASYTFLNSWSFLRAYSAMYVSLLYWRFADQWLMTD